MDVSQRVLKEFEQIAAIPRATKHEQEISGWLQDWAARRSFEARTDQAGNLVIHVPPSPGYEKTPGIVLQGHMDMVCEKTPDSPHDFSKNPIRCIVDGDWLHADRTTLGADNGIAIALALTLMEDASAPHPPLELLFTVEEEIGIGGASRLEPDFITGKILVNLDSEDEGVFTVGCAGGNTSRITLPLTWEASSQLQAYELKVSGLLGGHSGVDIDKHRANANKILARALDQARRTAGIRLVTLQGGTAHNAIAREASAVIACRPAEFAALQQAVVEFESIVKSEFSVTEKTLAVSLSPAQTDSVMTEVDSNEVVNLLLALPHGVAEMSAGIEGFVETSNNLAIVTVEEKTLHIVVSQRSTVMSRLDEITRRIEAIAALADANVTSDDGYPAWQPDIASPLLARSKEIYERLFEETPQVKMIHAGLECGIIGEKYINMDMISIGLTIQDAHSPNERLYIPSVTKIYALLADLLRSYRA